MAKINGQEETTLNDVDASDEAAEKAAKDNQEGSGEQDYLAEMVESMSPEEMKKVVELCQKKLGEDKSNEVLDMDELSK